MSPINEDHRRFTGSTIVFVGLAIATTVASGALHARVSRIWGSEHELELAATRLGGLPEQIGDWRREAEYELGDSAMELLQCSGYLHHGYRHQRTGQYVKVAVMAGPGSNISIHIPEICFESTNYTLTQPRQKVNLHDGDEGDSFWSVQFESNDVSQTKVKVLYGWKADGDWLAPRMPRWSVAGYPALYKLQLTEQIPGGDDDGCGQQFLKVFLPVLEQSMKSEA